VLVFMSTASGTGGDDAATTSELANPPTETTDSTIADDTIGDETATTDAADPPAETIDSTIVDETMADETVAPPDGERDGELSPTSCSETADEWSEIIDGAVPEAPVPGGLADAVPPADVEGVIALFEGLPDELIGGAKAISARTQGDFAAGYTSPDRASPYGFQAADLPNSFMGSVLPEPRADMLVAFFVLSDDDDYTVEAAGHDGDLYWVTYITTNSGYGIDGIEEVYTITWGEACGPWAFQAGAPTEAGRDELIAAFIAAAEQVTAAPDPGPATPDEQAAAAALVTLDDLGPDWFESPRLPQENAGFEELAKDVLSREPVCAAALDWLEQEDAKLRNLSDVFAADPIAGAESATFTSEFDGMSEIEHSVSVFQTSDELIEAFRLGSELGWGQCVIAVFGDLTQELYQSVWPGMSITVDSAVERPLELGDQAFALHFELTFEAPDGSSIEITEEFSMVAVGRATSVVTMFSFDHAIDDQADDIIARAADGLAEQFGESG
jgi:hypothetical protein